MPRKPIEIFNISFLDLLSGALGAVVLLYVLVPRMPISTEQFEEQKKLKDEMDKLGVKVADLRNSIPKPMFEKLLERLRTLQEATDALEVKTKEIQEELSACVEGSEVIRETIRTTRAQTEQTTNARQECLEKVESLSSTMRFLVITLQWETKGQDVDLLVVYPDGSSYLSGDNAVGDHGVTATLDNRKGPGIEVWQSMNPQSGTYNVYANLYSRDGEGTEGRIVSANPQVKMRVYHRNGYREFSTTLTRASYESRTAQATAEQQRTRSFETAVLISKLQIQPDGKIEFN